MARMPFAEIVTIENSIAVIIPVKQLIHWFAAAFVEAKALAANEESNLSWHAISRLVNNTPRDNPKCIEQMQIYT